MSEIAIVPTLEAMAPTVVEEIKPLELKESEEMLRTMIVTGDPSITIAEKLNLTLEEAEKHIKRYQRKWLVNLDQFSKEEAKAEAVVRLEYVYAEYHHAWQRSKKGIKVMRMGGGIEMTQETSSPGDDKFLKGMQWCLEKKLQLMDVVSAGSAPTALPAQNFNVNLVAQLAHSIPQFTPVDASSIASQPPIEVTTSKE